MPLRREGTEKPGLLGIGPRDAESGLVQVVVETPAGSRNIIRNDRLIGTAETAKIRPAVRSLEDLPSPLLDQIEHFFVAYNRFEGREFVARRRRGPAAAAKRLEKGIREHEA